ncbi:MAG: beta-N-acetylhexosaminidase [Proteobacteria bacterium]|nr:beta-N-acetylhexosaminidase [Pseudomonadota bacterium]MBU1586110.1 beta-N-acetylhexosaminidase [Pseudomonadota bacterium]MBU2454772.1 beta-N-acetylhexosaminidase [Pseudomonadota bacterium]MBU2630603.1 beta-N-acetylhexosaminidase [Pseudomonadota bacterium]
MAGQQLMLGFDGIDLNQELKHIIGEIKAGGIILFKRNIETPEQVASLCAACQVYAKACKIPPLFISVDQEGGTVARLKEPFTLFKGNPYIESVRDARDFASVTADELKQVGINMNLAPVLDIAPKGVDSIMKDRVFNGDEKKVSLLGKQVIHVLQKKGIMAVAKHFPGIGRTVKDSHFHLPVLDIDLETLKQTDMVPFAAAKNQDVSGIMLSHILYPQLDSQWQASLSPYIVNELLRNQLGYDGLVMTDDLDMKAIEHDMKTCIQQILSSGIDMTLICHKGPNIDIAFDEMMRLINDNERFYLMSEKSNKRILRAKKKYLSKL